MTNLFHSIAFMMALALTYAASASVDNDYQSPTKGIEQIKEKIQLEFLKTGAEMPLFFSLQTRIIIVCIIVISTSIPYVPLAISLPTPTKYTKISILNTL